MKQLLHKAKESKTVSKRLFLAWLLLPGAIVARDLRWTPQALSQSVPNLGVRVEHMGTMTADDLNQEITKLRPTITGQSLSLYDQYNDNGKGPARPFDAATMGAKNGVAIYRITYNTTIPENGKTYPVSGLLVVPDLSKNRVPLVSWQHGTVLDPMDTPSNLVRRDGQKLVFDRSVETLLNVVRLGGNGFAIAASDYIGNGQYASSPTAQTYAVKGATQQTTLDMILAAKKVLIQLGKPADSLFLNGWSQGGMNTQWLAEKLQTSGHAITRQSAICPPADTVKLVGYWMNDYPGDPPWLTSAVPLMFGAYEDYYGISKMLQKAIKPQYLDAARQMYKKQIPWQDEALLSKIIQWEKKGEPYFGFPRTPKEQINPEFINDFNNRRGSFYQHIAKNTALTVKYQAPIRFYAGSGDNVVPPRVSVQPAVAYQHKLGNRAVAVVDLGPSATHRSAFVGALFGSRQDPTIDLLTWFKAAQSRSPVTPQAAPAAGS